MVTGAAGQLAWAVRGAFEDCDLHARTRNELDVTDPDAVAREVAALRPDVVINCAAFNDVDGAEEQAQTALDINALAVRSLARAALVIGGRAVVLGLALVLVAGAGPIGAAP